MLMAIVTAALLVVGLLIISIANASLFAWSRGREPQFPIDRGEPEDVRLARAGADTTFGIFPIVVAMVLQSFSISDPLSVSVGQCIAAVAASQVYLVLYFSVIRKRFGAFRLKVRRLLLSSSHDGQPFAPADVLRPAASARS